jgi:hypothetical protein
VPDTFGAKTVPATSLQQWRKHYRSLAAAIGSTCCGNARIHAAKLISARIDSPFLPPFDVSDVLATLKLSHVRAAFPKGVIDVPETSAAML